MSAARPGWHASTAHLAFVGFRTGPMADPSI
ncbi:MAG: hypothetical protein JWM33_485 [Caulobacteraceae bacterium]|nr:hypothetical protein [Caulobacteraceae bacterium]